jgi:guanylate kinase
LGDNLLAKRPDIVRAVTCTTRAPRPGEEHGVHYYFFSLEEFEQRVVAGEFLEHANVYKNRYGTLKSEVIGKLRAGQDVLLTIDVQGAASVRKLAQNDAELAQSLVTVFLTPPSRVELEARLNGRGTETPEVLARRLQEATIELEQAPQFDYLLLSATPAEDVAALEGIVTSEHRRAKRLALPADLKAAP